MESIQAFNKSVLNLVINCYFTQDHSTLERLNISQEVAKRIAGLPSNVRHMLEQHKTPFVDLNLNESAINSAINNCYASGSRDDMYNQAIILGASKAMMRNLCNMSSAEFASRRKALNISEARVRPQSLTTDEELMLGELYQQVEGPKDSLEALVFLSEKSGIEINRIHTYFISMGAECAS